MAHRPVGTVYLLKRAELAVRAAMDGVLAAFDLTPAQFLLLYQLSVEGPSSAAALARGVGVRPQSMGEIIAPLEHRRLIRRQPSATHGRIRETSLTRTGQTLLQKALPVAAQVELELLGALDDVQVAALQHALKHIRDQADARSHEARGAVPARRARVG